jgi:hypothetical protein
MARASIAFLWRAAGREAEDVDELLTLFHAPQHEQPSVGGKNRLGGELGPQLLVRSRATTLSPEREPMAVSPSLTPTSEAGIGISKKLTPSPRSTGA